MPSTRKKIRPFKKPEDVVATGELYSLDTYDFIQEGLHRADESAHGRVPAHISANRTRHISGQQLCEGLRQVAIERWGLMAPAVLATWRIHRTLDFGKIVFALIDAGLFAKQPEDSVDDFANVYDFREAFVLDFHITLSGRPS